MKIGLIAMSGVRVRDPELIRLGLNLPGFVERSKVIASLPSLGLLTLAGMTPSDIEVEYREIADVEAMPDLARGYDLVAISTFTAQSLDAYTVADRFRAMGVPVVIGGLHATVMPEEAAAHADAVVVGEGEMTWAQVVEDARAGRLRPIYRPQPGRWFDLADAPMPRFESLDIAKYNRLTVQTSRGCPHNCEFCASSILLTPKYRVKPVEKVIAEVRKIKSLWEHPFIEFADDNSFATKGHYRALLEALRHEHIKWFTEADVSVADDPALLDLMSQSGCRQVLIGLESPGSRALDGIETRRNWKLKQFDRYERAVREIQSRGITVNGCFILGLDGDTEEVFDAVYDFVDRTGLYEVQITVLTPFPGTPLYRRLKAEGRLTCDGAWDRCTLFDVNFVPARMSAERLRQGLLDLTTRLYENSFVRGRRERFFRDLKACGRRPGPGLVEAA